MLLHLHRAVTQGLLEVGASVVRRGAIRRRLELPADGLRPKMVTSEVLKPRGASQSLRRPPAIECPSPGDRLAVPTLGWLAEEIPRSCLWPTAVPGRDCEYEAAPGS